MAPPVVQSCMLFDEIQDSMQRPEYSQSMQARRAILFASASCRIMFFLLFFFSVTCIAPKVSAQAWPDGIPVDGEQDQRISKAFPDGRTLQQVLEDLDRSLTRSDGLYRGTLTLLRRDEPAVVQDFELIVRSPQAYMTIRSARRAEELRLLWTGQGMQVWMFDVLRRQLIRPEASQRFDPLPTMGFSPVDFFYPWFAANLKPHSWRVDSLRPDWTMIDCTLLEIEEPQLSIGIDSAGRPARVEVKERGILLRVLEFRQGRPLTEWKTNRQFVPDFPALYEMMDLRRASVARFEMSIYDPKFRPHPSLFDPDYLSR